MRSMHVKDSHRIENRLAEIREAQDLLQSELAGRLRVDQSTVWRWERGAPIPDRRKLQLAEMLGVSVARLMGWPEGSPPSAADAA